MQSNKRKASEQANERNWYDVTDEFLRQSTDDAVFFGMSDEEFDERANRLAFKALNGIHDAETRAADERVLKNALMFEGIEEYERILRFIALTNVKR